MPSRKEEELQTWLGRTCDVGQVRQGRRQEGKKAWQETAEAHMSSLGVSPAPDSSLISGELGAPVQRPQASEHQHFVRVVTHRRSHVPTVLAGLSHPNPPSSPLLSTLKLPGALSQRIMDLQPHLGSLHHHFPSPSTASLPITQFYNQCLLICEVTLTPSSTKWYLIPLV